VQLSFRVLAMSETD